MLLKCGESSVDAFEQRLVFSQCGPFPGAVEEAFPLLVVGLVDVVGHHVVAGQTVGGLGVDVGIGRVVEFHDACEEGEK